MVTKKKLIKKIESLEYEVEFLKKGYKPFMNAVIAINKKVVMLINKDNATNTNKETETIKEWLSDDRINELQSYLNKEDKK